MKGLFLYLIQKISDEKDLIKPDLLILKEVIEKMSGVNYIENLNSL